jgi:queuine tRNA-ribosyltransferase
MEFLLEHTDAHTNARAGTLKLSHGDVQTPVFMPVGTQGTVKALTVRDIEETGAQMILGNTYHLFLRPGSEIIQKAGGLHSFTGWQGPVLTDSGGYQVYSLADLRKLNDQGVTFKSHVDGTAFTFTPESVVKIQEQFGVDIMMQLDECPPSHAGRKEIAAAVARSALWAQRSADAWSSTASALFGIVQGGLHADLRQHSAEQLTALDLPGYALGGFSVGEDMSEAYPVIERAAQMLPGHKPRYLMGVGFPEDIVRAVGSGVDMFDCVLPTRCARNGMCFFSAGRLRIKNAAYKDDMRPIDPACSCYACRTFSRAYLRHLFMAGEITALVLMTIHNITYYVNLCRRMREAILQNAFAKFSRDFFASLSCV